MDIKLDNDAHAGAIAVMARWPEVRFIMVDFPRGGHSRNEDKSGDMAALGKWLAELARETNKPIVVSQLLRKKSAFDADEITLDRVSGSTAIVQFARMVWAIDTPEPASQGKKTAPGD